MNTKQVKRPTLGGLRDLFCLGVRAYARGGMGGGRQRSRSPKVTEFCAMSIVFSRVEG